VKHTLYIAACMLLSILSSTVLHGAIEMYVIDLLATDFERYGLGLPWSTWYSIHAYASVMLLVLGLAGGYVVGERWYRYIYLEKHRGFIAALLRR